ncbi:LysM peptidoglycan-binding domain-containing protein [Wenyingzhuangia sp. IMCC45533]
MTKIFRTIAVLFLILSFSVSAQNVKDYTSKKGETLKEIADKFGVSYLSLIKLNKGVSKRPKANTLIKIPENIFVKPKHPIDYRADEKSDLTFVKEKDSLKVHKVQAKETLYSLSKLYNVSMSDLIKKNTFLSQEGLKIGQELIIPIVAVQQTKDAQNKVRLHNVKEKETLYSIAKKYGVTIDEIKEKNVTVLMDGVKAGSVLEIPLKKNTENRENNSQGHQIVKGETLYGISRKYGISIPELLSVNKTVVVDSLSVGTILNLPNKVLVNAKTSNTVPIYVQKPVKYRYNAHENLNTLLKELEISKDSLKSLNPSLDSILNYGGELLIGFKKEHLLFESNKTFKDSIVKDKEVNLVLMLPFDFKTIDTLSATTLFSSVKGLPSMVADFYMGVEIAVDSLKKQGVDINFTVVDTEKSVDSIRNKIEQIRAFRPSVIVGPLYTDNVAFVASTFPETSVYYPIYSKNQKLLTAKSIVKTATDRSLFVQQMEAYIKENRKGEHLLIVGLDKNVKYLKELKNKLIKRDSLGAALDNDVTVLSLPKEYVAKEEFLSHIKMEKDNWILIAENSNAIAAGVFNNSKLIPKDSVLDTPVRILSFEKSNYAEDNMLFQKLAEYRYTYATDQVEYEMLLNRNFDKNYLNKNGSFPTQFSSRGFSVTYDAVLRFLKQGQDDTFKAAQRGQQAFDYEVADTIKNKNQAVFINAIENKQGVLKIIRLR